MGLRVLGFCLRFLERETRPRATVGTLGATTVLALSIVFWLAGSQPALFLAAATMAAIGADAAFAVAAARHVRAEVVANETDAVAGDTVRLSIALVGPARPCALRLWSNPASAGVMATPPAEGHLAAYLEHRGLFDEVALEVTACGPCGLMGWVRRRPLVLQQPIAVGPRPLEPATPARLHAAALAGATLTRRAPSDLVRSVRPYVPGDAARHVHWPATAHAGELLVKEVEEELTPRLLLVLDLGEGGEAAERAARRAAWYALEALRHGSGVTLATAEALGPVTAPVSSALDVNRRLARAVPGTPGAGRLARSSNVALVVSAEGDRWS